MPPGRRELSGRLRAHKRWWRGVVDWDLAAAPLRTMVARAVAHPSAVSADGSTLVSALQSAAGLVALIERI